MTQHRDLPHIADEADLQSVRSALLWQLSKGATEGLVEIKNPFRKPESQDHPPPRQQIRIGNSIDPAAAERQPGRMREDGSACFSDDDLAIASWGRPGPVSTGIGPVMSGLLGEFDLPDTAAVAQAARYLLYLGFGAETRQLLTGLHIQSAQKPLWDAMAHILDLEPEQNRIFDGMEGCDTAAALWAVLAQPGRTETGRVNIPAVLRNFSALPLHLRKHLGPSLAESFLADGDLATSRAIRDAILRSRDDPQPGVNLLAARLDMASGHTKAGKAELEALSLKPGLEGIDATIALAQIEAADGGEVSADLTTALEAFFHEARGGTSGPGLREVLAVAYASQNRFGQAFALLPSDAASASVLWERLAYYGNDTAIVENAILSENQVVAALPAATVRHLAKRLTELGFSRAALGWLSEKRMKPDAATDDSVLLRAEAALADMDGRQALRELAGSASEKAELLRARALTLLQDNTAAASYAKTDATDEWAVSARQRQSWPEFASLSPDQPWAGALALIGQHSSSTSETARPENLPEGPLARARLALGESAKARTVLQDLLAQTELRPALQ